MLIPRELTLLATLASAIRQEKATRSTRTGKGKVTLNLFTIFFNMMTWETPKNPWETTSEKSVRIASNKQKISVQTQETVKDSVVAEIRVRVGMFHIQSECWLLRASCSPIQCTLFNKIHFDKRGS